MSERAEALKWAASVLESEARWQWERSERRVVGAQLIAQRMDVMHRVLLEAAKREEDLTTPTPAPRLRGPEAETEEA